MSTADAVPIEELLRHAEWLRSLARALVGRDGDIDDLVQDVFTRALVSGPRDRERTKSWLRRVMHNRVYEDIRRSAVRRRAMARLAAETAVASDSDAVERILLESALNELVVALPEHFRFAIVGTYYRGLSATALALESGRAASTIRSHRSRGLALLRQQLSGDKDGDDRELVALLLPLLLPARLPPLRVHVGRGARAAAAFLCAAVAASAAWYGLTGDGASDQAPSPADERRPLVASRERGRVGARPTRAGGVVAVPGVDDDGDRASNAPDPRRVLTILAQLPRLAAAAERTGQPWQLEIWALAPGQEPQLAPRGTMTLGSTGAAVRVTLSRPVTDVADLWISADHPAFLPVRWSEPVAPETTGGIRVSYEPELQPAAHFRVEVVDELGRPRAGAHVSVSEVTMGENGATRAESTTTDATGVALLRATPGVPVVLVACDDASVPAAVWLVSDKPGSRQDARLTLRPGRELVGNVSCSDRGVAEEPEVLYRAARGDVFVGDLGTRFWGGGGRVWRATAQRTTDGAGRFSFSGLAENGGTVEFRCRMATGDVLPVLAVEPAGGERLPDVVIETAAVELAVTGHATPIPGARVEVDCEPRPIRVSTDRHGVTRFCCRADTRYSLTVRADGYETAVLTLTSPAVGEAIRREISLQGVRPGRTWRIDPGPDPRPLPPRIGVALFDGGERAGQPLHELEGLLDHGAYLLANVPTGTFRASLRLGGAWREGRSAFADVEVAIDTTIGDPIPTRMSFVRGGRLRLAAADEAGRLLAADCRVSSPGCDDWGVRFLGGHLSSSRRARSHLGASGFALADRVLPAGTYTVHLTHLGFLPLDREIEVRDGRVHELRLTMTSQ